MTISVVTVKMAGWCTIKHLNINVKYFTLYISLNLMLFSSVVRYPRYLDTYRRYLRDDTSIAKVKIYRGIS